MNSTTNDSTKLFAMNKPKGYLVTRSDDLGRKTVYDLLPAWAYEDGWMPIGRLDLESKGLLLFTRDGQIGNVLTKPGNCIKIYEIWVRGHVSEEHIKDALKDAKFGTPLKVLDLCRVSIGSLKLNIENSKWRYLSLEEEKALLKNLK